jgi:hypothetical protein
MPMLPREMRKSAGLEVVHSPSPCSSRSPSPSSHAPSPQRESSRFPSAKKLEHLHRAKKGRTSDCAAQSPNRSTPPFESAVVAGSAAQNVVGSPKVPQARISAADGAELRRGRSRNVDWSLEGTVSNSGGAKGASGARADSEGSESSGAPLCFNVCNVSPSQHDLLVFSVRNLLCPGAVGAPRCITALCYGMAWKRLRKDSIFLRS